jgi:hypothetical protein
MGTGRPANKVMKRFVKWVQQRKLLKEQEKRTSSKESNEEMD